MSIINSIGGHVVIDGSPDITVPVGQWRGNWAVRLAETGTSSSGGTRYSPVRQDPQWSASFPLDSAGYPEAVGLSGGAVLNMYFLLGGGGKADQLQGTTVESVSVVCDPNNDGPRGSHGQGWYAGS